MRLRRTRTKPHDRHHSAAWERDLAPQVQDGESLGAAAAAHVDADYGGTRPAAAVLVDREASAMSTGILPDFQERSARDEIRLRRLGAALVHRKKRHDARVGAFVEARVEANARADELAGEDGEHRQAGRFWWLIALSLVVFGIGDVALAESVLQLLNLWMVQTWMIAIVVGVAQLALLHYAGVEFTRISSEDTNSEDSGGPARTGRWRPLVILAVCLGIAIPLAVTLALLRAEDLALNATQTGQGLGHPASQALVKVTGKSTKTVSKTTAFIFFLAMQLLLDALAFVVGYRGGRPAVRAVAMARGNEIVASIRQTAAAFRWTRAARRFGRAYADATGLCAATRALIDKIAREHRARSAAVYVGIAHASDAETAAAMSEEAQLTGLDTESVTSIVEALAAVDARNVRIDEIARGFGYAYPEAGRDGEPGSEEPGSEEPGSEEPRSEEPGSEASSDRQGPGGAGGAELAGGEDDQPGSTIVVLSHRSGDPGGPGGKEA